MIKIIDKIFSIMNSDKTLLNYFIKVNVNRDNKSKLGALKHRKLIRTNKFFLF